MMEELKKLFDREYRKREILPLIRSAIFGGTVDGCCCFTGNGFMVGVLSGVGVSCCGSCWRWANWSCWTWVGVDDCWTGATDDVAFTC